MNTFFLSGLFEDDPGVGRMSSAMKERLIVLGAMLAVLLLVLGWAILFRQKRRRAARRADRHHRRHSFSKNAARNVTEIKKFVREGERRRRHHRPRNPTLAETGGLPPVREATSPPRAPTP